MCGGGGGEGGGKPSLLRTIQLSKGLQIEWDENKRLHDLTMSNLYNFVRISHRLQSHVLQCDNLHESCYLSQPGTAGPVQSVCVQSQ